MIRKEVQKSIPVEQEWVILENFGGNGESLSELGQREKNKRVTRPKARVISILITLSENSFQGIMRMKDQSHKSLCAHTPFLVALEMRPASY